MHSSLITLLAKTCHGVSSLLNTWDFSPVEMSTSQRQKFHTDDVMSGIWSGALIGWRSSYIILAIVYEWQTKDEATKVKCKRNESNNNKTVDICGLYFPLEEAFELCWSSFADEHKTLPKSTSRNITLNKFASGIQWLTD